MVYCEKCDGNHSDSMGTCVDIEPRKAYDIISKGGDSTYRVAIFSRSEVESAYGPINSDNAETTIARLVGWGESYNGPGRSFSHAPYMRVLRRNIVVRQFCGLDI